MWCMVLLARSTSTSHRASLATTWAQVGMKTYVTPKTQVSTVKQHSTMEAGLRMRATTLSNTNRTLVQVCSRLEWAHTTTMTTSHIRAQVHHGLAPSGEGLLLSLVARASSAGQEELPQHHPSNWQCHRPLQTIHRMSTVAKGLTIVIDSSFRPSSRGK